MNKAVLSLSNPESSRLLDDYILHIDANLSSFEPHVAAELRGDLLAHLRDAYHASTISDEVARLKVVLDRLGKPELYLAEAMADEWMEEGTRRFAPAALSSGLLASLRLGGWRAIRAIAVTTALVAAVAFLLIGLLSPVLPAQVGLLVFPNGQKLFGFTTSSDARELLGWWRIPLGILGTCMIWLLVRYMGRKPKH